MRGPWTETYVLYRSGFAAALASDTSRAMRARRAGRAAAGRRDPHRDVSGLERLVDRADEIALHGVQVHGLAQPGGECRRDRLGVVAVRLNRRSTARCTRRRSGLNSAAAASVAAATATGVLNGSTRSAEAKPPTEAERDELTATAGETDQWIKDLAAGHRAFADRLADQQSQTVPSEDPDYGDLGQAFPSWSGPAALGDVP